MTDEPTDGPTMDTEKLLNDPSALQDFNATVAEQFRANGGKVGGDFQGAPLVLLHTVGAKSGTSRVSPLAYVPVEGKTLIVGSYGGSPKHPAWVHNLRANPGVHVEIATGDGIDEYDGTARELPEDERAEVFPKLVAVNPVFGEYQAKTSRAIPLFELVRDA